MLAVGSLFLVSALGNLWMIDEPALPTRRDDADVEADLAPADASRARADGVATGDTRRRPAAVDRARSQDARRGARRSLDAS